MKTSYDKATYTKKSIPLWKSLSSEKSIGEIKLLYSNQEETEGKRMSFSGYLQFEKPYNKGYWFLYIHINIYIYFKSITVLPIRLELLCFTD